MKKLLVLVLALCLLIPAAAVMAEDDEEISFYTEEVPEAAAYVSTWVAEDGDWRIEFFDEDGGIKLMVVHRLGDNQEDVWEYAAALNEEKTALVSMPLGLHYRQDTVTNDWVENYYEDGDATFTNENKEIYRARKEGFYTSINLGFRLAGGVNLLFGNKSDTWGPGYLGNFGLFVRIPFGAQTFRLMTAVDFSYRRYLYEETTEFSDNEAYVEMYMFEIPLMLRYIGEDDGFFFGIGGDLGLKLSGFSEFKQESEIEGKLQKDKRDKTIPTNGVEIGAIVDFGYLIDGHFGIDIRIVQYFTNLLDEDNLAESTLFKSELWPFNATFGVFYQF